ncbi:tetratricopeptide repeat protein [Anaeramoeba flamelloides]|uniref:Tetratricopeptide repeat protein n=1 Tax=Anaeramoeba flamelloides TaxID=1746091 RepID=A0ABQ8X1J8_9EUKA|nr:tetratricopeptide repeat protein [Anaeramoeba flamelloides]
MTNKKFQKELFELKKQSEICFSNGEYEKVIHLLKPTKQSGKDLNIRQFSESHAHLVQCQDLLAKCYERVGAKKKAIKMYQKIVNFTVPALRDIKSIPRQIGGILPRVEFSLLRICELEEKDRLIESAIKGYRNFLTLVLRDNVFQKETFFDSKPIGIALFRLVYLLLTNVCSSIYPSIKIKDSKILKTHFVPFSLPEETYLLLSILERMIIEKPNLKINVQLYHKRDPHLNRMRIISGSKSNKSLTLLKKKNLKKSKTVSLPETNRLDKEKTKEKEKEKTKENTKSKKKETKNIPKTKTKTKSKLKSESKNRRVDREKYQKNRMKSMSISTFSPTNDKTKFKNEKKLLKMKSKQNYDTNSDLSELKKPSKRSKGNRSGKSKKGNSNNNTSKKNKKLPKDLNKQKAKAKSISNLKKKLTKKKSPKNKTKIINAVPKLFDLFPIASSIKMNMKDLSKYFELAIKTNPNNSHYLFQLAFAQDYDENPELSLITAENILFKTPNNIPMILLKLKTLINKLSKEEVALSFANKSLNIFNSKKNESKKKKENKKRNKNENRVVKEEKEEEEEDDDDDDEKYGYGTDDDDDDDSGDGDDDDNSFIIQKLKHIIGICHSKIADKAQNESKRLKHQKLAIQTLDDSFKNDPTDPDIAFNLALLYAKLRWLDDATYYARLTLKLNPHSSPRPWELLALIMTAKKQFRVAAEICEAAMVQFPESIDLILLKADIYYELMNIKTQRVFLIYKQALDLWKKIFLKNLIKLGILVDLRKQQSQKSNISSLPENLSLLIQNFESGALLGRSLNEMVIGLTANKRKKKTKQNAKNTDQKGKGGKSGGSGSGRGSSGSGSSSKENNIKINKENRKDYENYKQALKNKEYPKTSNSDLGSSDWSETQSSGDHWTESFLNQGLLNNQISLNNLKQFGKQSSQQINKNQFVRSALLTYAKIWNLAARSYIKIGKLDDALTCIRESYILSIIMPDCFFAHGLIEYEKHNFANALDVFEKALLLDPKHIESLCYKGLVYLKQAKHEKNVEKGQKINIALTHLKSAVKMNPSSHLAWKSLGIARKHQSQYLEKSNGNTEIWKKAIDCLNKATKLESTNPVYPFKNIQFIL